MDPNNFTAKINQLNDFSARLNAGGVNIEVISREIVTSLKYFETQLISWIKDSDPCYKPSECDFDRNQFPNVDYLHLMQALLDLIPNLHNEQDAELNNLVLRTIACIVPFIDKETLLNLLVTLSDTLYDVQQFFHLKIVDLLSQYFIPFVYGFMTHDKSDDLAEINLLIPAILSNVLDATSEPASWTKVMECIMRFKKNASTDLLMVLAYGSKESLKASLHLLNRYFPPVDIASIKAYQSPPYENIRPYTCQYQECSGSNRDAVIECLDPIICARYNDSPPPMYLCQKCHDSMDRMESPMFIHVNQPADLVSQICDNSNCRFGFMKALYFCFSLDCIKRNDYKPIRLCEDCHQRLHADLHEPHINHECLKELWITGNPEQTYLVDAIIRLGMEAQPNFQEKCSRMGLDLDVEIVDKSQQDLLQYIGKIFTSLHGLLLLQKTCPYPPTVYHLEHLGRLVAMLFVWVESVDYASHHEAVKIVNPNRQQAVAWLNKVAAHDFNFYCSCLLPAPPKHARVGHPWNMLTSVLRKDMEILQRITTLAKYGLVPENVWEEIMPHWFHEIKTAIPVSEIKKFKTILLELFDMNSETRPEYAINFIRKNLESSILKQSQEALVWVQILSYLDVQLEITSLIEMFIELLLNKDDGLSAVDNNIQSVFSFPDKDTIHKVTSSGTLSRQNSLHSTPLKSPLGATLLSLKTVQDDLSISILMLDVLIKQLTLQKSPSGSVYIADKESISLNVLLSQILDQSFEGEHVELPGFSCPRCQIMNTVFYLVALLVDLAIKRQVTLDQAKTEYTNSVISRRNSSSASRKSRDTTSLKSRFSSGTPVNTSKLDQTPLVGSHNDDVIIEEDENDRGAAAANSVVDGAAKYLKERVFRVESGRFKSDISESSLNSIPELQILERLLQELSECHESSVVVHILTSLDILCIRGECLEMVADQDLDLLEKLQRHQLIPNLWRRLESTNSNIGRTVVPLLLHCASLPYGADHLCQCMESDFTNDDWKTRFSAVDKVGLLCQFIEARNIKEGKAKSAVVHAVCYMTIAMEDINSTVSTRARSVLQSIKISSLKPVYGYMKEHFVKVVEDRLVLLNAYRTLHMVIPESSPLSGTLLLDLLKLAKYVDDKTIETHIKKELQRGSTIMDTSIDPECLPMYTRKSREQRARLGQQSQAPINCYRRHLTIQTGTLWIDGPRDSDNLRRLTRIVSTDVAPKMDPSLHTVTEEDEQSTSNSTSNCQSLHDLTVTNDLGSAEDEILSSLSTLVFEFLSSKDTKQKIDSDLINTNFEQVCEIVNYFGHAMGFEPTNSSWKANKAMNTKRFRKNPIFVSFLMNLPYLLDGNVERGKLFLPLALVVMETCIKPKPTEPINQSTTTLSSLESHLLNAWIMSLLVILYKYPIQENSTTRETIWTLMSVVKNTLDGHGHHVCSGKIQQQVMSMRNVVHLKMNLKTVFKKHDQTKQTNSSGGGSALGSHHHQNGEIEMTDFSGDGGHHDQTASALNSTDMGDNRLSRPASELFLGIPDTTEELLVETNQQNCQRCKMTLFNHSEEIINSCLISLLTYVHMDPERSASFIVDLVKSVVWKAQVMPTSGTCKLPKLGLTNTASIAQQFLRCVFAKMAQSRLFPELFGAEKYDEDFFMIITTVLTEFPFLSLLEPIKLILQDFMQPESQINKERYMILRNLSGYIEKMVDGKHIAHKEWNSLKSTFQSFFSNVENLLPKGRDMDCLLNIMTLLLTHQHRSVKFLMEELENAMTFIIKHCKFSVQALYNLTSSTVVSSKEKDQSKLSRDQMKLTRKVAFLLANTLAGKGSLPEVSLTKLVQFFCHDAGTKYHFDDVNNELTPNTFKPRAVECLDINSSSEIIEYLKNPCKRIIKELNDNENYNYFSNLKLALYQFVSVYLNNIDSKILRDSRFYYKLSAVLLTEISQERQQAASISEMHEHATHFRIYSWLLLGAINHSVVMETPISRLIPLVKAAYISEYLNVVFDVLRKELSEDVLKKSKTRAMLQLSFYLMQIWNVYIELHYEGMENQDNQSIHPSANLKPITVIKEFWSKITPSLYSLLKHSQKMKLESIPLFLQVVENLSLHCPKTFSQLYPMWKPLLEIYSNEVPSSARQRIKEFDNLPSERSNVPRGDSLSYWVSDIRKKLWNAERLTKGKLAQVVNV
ncbi:protein unc-79 homolog isoform X2 [Clytia hemisphaerica]|uniref:protein unc-79 homolog isoform X2 n=1 Tax=Clytia hemisphaerica TaxID=252671 RepID=UPI0034D54960